MKKITYSILAAGLILAAFGCSKELREATPATAPEDINYRTVTIRAGIDDLKTSYDENGKFSWVEGDAIGVVIEDGEGKLSQVQFVTSDNDPIAEFTGQVPEGWEMTGIATYPFNESIFSDIFLDYEDRPDPDPNRVVNTYRLGSSIAPGAEEALSRVPLTGILGEDGFFRFKTSVGILHFTIKDVPAEAKYLYLSSETYPLNGWFDLDAEGAVLAENAKAGWGDAYNWTAAPAEGGDMDYWFYVPVGTIPAGLNVALKNGNDDVLTFTTKAEIVVGRNCITNIEPVGYVDPNKWVSLGTGKFIDNHGFYNAYGWSNANIDYDNGYLDVEIQQREAAPNEYRLVNPYGPLFADPINATALNGATGPDAYLTFQLRDDIGDGIVLNDKFYMGFEHYEYDVEMWFDHPYWHSYQLYDNSRVIAYATDGSPANIQLAPIYFGGSTEDCSANPKIEIVFPGFTPMLGGYFNYANGASAAYAEGKVSVTISDANITAVKVFVTTSLDNGIQTLQEGTDAGILTFTATGSQDLALEKGSYILVYKVETDGHGWTYKYTAFDMIPSVKIALTESMVTAVGTCNWGDDNGGIPALIDGDPSTYWHSDWYYGITGNDSVYGLFFTITLEDAIQTFHYKFVTRSSGSNATPSHVVYGVSSDGTNWTKIDEQDTGVTATTGGGVTVTLKSVDAGTPVKYLRFGVTESTDAANYSDDFCGDMSADGYKKSFNLAELELYCED